MKKTIGVVVILAALILLSYFGMGYITERTLKRDINVINQSSGGVHVDTVEYQRGWFTSKARFEAVAHVPERVVKNAENQPSVIPPQDYKFDIPLTIYHGPIIFADAGVRFGYGYAYTHLAMPKGYTEQFDRLFTSQSTKPEMDLSVLVNYLNKSRFRVKVPAFKLISREGNGQFDWQGLVSDVSVSSNHRNFEGNLNIQGIQVTKDTTKADLVDISSDYDISQSKEGLYIGKADFSFPSIIITDKDARVFELKQFNVQSDSSVERGLFRSYFKSTLDKAITHNKTYGPGTLEVALKNLDAGTLAQINDQLNRIQQASQQEKQQTWFAIIPELPKLFSRGPEFTVSKMSLVVPEGTIEGHLKLSLPEGKATNPFQLIQRIQGEGAMKIPASVLQQLMRQSARQQLKQQQEQTTSGQLTSPASEQPNTPQNTAQKNPAISSDPAAPGTTISSQTSEGITVNEEALDEQARAQADQKIAALVQLGLLTPKENDYVIDFKFLEGQLTVNGQPFNPAAAAKL